jgi:serine/threonine-protein kinase RsbT
VQLALEDGFSTSGGLGLGLPGARRLMDDFEIHTQIGHGTVVTMCKWAR